MASASRNCKAREVPDYCNTLVDNFVPSISRLRVSTYSPSSRASSHESVYDAYDHRNLDDAQVGHVLDTKPSRGSVPVHVKPSLRVIKRLFNALLTVSH